MIKKAMKGASFMFSKKMLISLKIVFFFPLFFLLPWSLANHAIACNQEWSFLIAQPVAQWPDFSTEKTFPLQDRTGLSLFIPSDFEKIYYINNLLIFSYHNKKATITIETISKKTIDNFPADHCMELKDIAHAIFTKTPKDELKNCPEVWQWAMKSKLTYFRKNVPVYVAKNGNVTAYYHSSTDQYVPSQIGSLAVIVNENEPESFSVIRTIGFDLNYFLNIIGSIREPSGGH
ncbi:hypothetical protein [Desulfuromonas sp. CSMB_57]|uniref:hypothetical protein n=1 Tax=Desulfuromonas sp. CSMB_57 TaxID=2807629 RepID=UPI001CD4E2E4|nr:hypothetical protein [Desulfuromonas sp. CSMB_57]